MDAYYSAQLRARQIMDETGMSLDDVLKLDMSEYARLTNRQTPTQAALAALADLDAQAPRQEAPTQPPAAPEIAPQGVSVQDMSFEQYAALRGQLGMTGREYGVGIMNGAAGTGAWAAAAKAKAGRHGWENANSVEAPRLEGRTVLKQDQQLDTRSAAQRFSNQANMWQGR
jgi:hypothetical protein